MNIGTKQRDLGRAMVIAAVALIVLCAWLPQIQDLAAEQVDDGLQRALISFASARVLNGLISVVQGTELSMQPLGVGLTLTVGQALDPVNDLVEQFSALMLYASVAFGIQKVLLSIGGNWVVSLLVSGTAVVWAWLYARHRAPAWLSRMLLVLLMVRFAIPVVTLGSNLVYERLLAEDYARHQQTLVAVSDVVRSATPAAVAGGAGSAAAPDAGHGAQAAPDGRSPASAAASAPQKGWIQRRIDQVFGSAPEAEDASAAAAPSASAPARGLFGRWTDRAASVMSVPDFEAIRDAVAGLPERVVGLIVIFLLQTMIVPIVLLWALYRTVLIVARR